MISRMILHIQQKHHLFFVYHIRVPMSPLPQVPRSLYPCPRVRHPRIQWPHPRPHPHVPVPLLVMALKVYPTGICSEAY